MSKKPSEQFAILTQQLHTTTSPWDRLPLLIELAMQIETDSPDYAHQCATEALSIAKGLNDPFWTACGLAAVGMNLLKTSRYSEVLFYLEQASEMFEHLNDPRRKAETDCRIAKVYIITMDIPKALPLLTQALTVFQSIGDAEWTANALTLFGDIHARIGEHSQAIEDYHRVLTILVELNLESSIGGMYGRIASLYRQIEDQTNHSRYAFKALAVYQKREDKIGIAVALGNIANMYLDERQHARAAPYIEQSLELYRQLGYTNNEAMAWGKMSIIYRERGDIAEAFRCYRKGLALCRKSEDKPTLGKLYETLGVLCHKTGRPQHCLHYFLKALSVFEELGDLLYLHQIHRLLALIYEELGNPEKGLHHFKEFDRIREEYAGINKRIQSGMTEQILEVRKVMEQLKVEESANTELQETLREKETRLTSLTLELIRSGETEKKRKGEAASSSSASADILNTENWDLFARQFHKVHHGFYPGLLKRCPSLTPTEAKVCSLIKAGLSSKEIAEILCISKRTVDNHRAHVNKKMALPHGASLSKFIADI